MFVYLRWACLSGSFTCVRRRGQLALLIQLNAIKVSATEYGLKRFSLDGTAAQPDLPADCSVPHFGASCANDCWISLEDLRCAGVSLPIAQRLHSSQKSFSAPIIGFSQAFNTSLLQEDKEKGECEQHCCCWCWGHFLRIFHRRETSRPSSRAASPLPLIYDAHALKSKSDRDLLYLVPDAGAAVSGSSDTDSGVESQVIMFCGWNSSHMNVFLHCSHWIRLCDAKRLYWRPRASCWGKLWLRIPLMWMC